MIFTYSYDFFKAWDLALLLMCQHRKICNYYPKGTNRKQKSGQFNRCVQVFTESCSLTLNLNLLNHKPINYLLGCVYNVSNVYSNRKLVTVADWEK